MKIKNKKNYTLISEFTITLLAFIATYVPKSLIVWQLWSTPVNNVWCSFCIKTFDNDIVKLVASAFPERITFLPY